MTITNENIGHVKELMSRIKPSIEAIEKVWPSHKLTMISVLVQNLCFFPLMLIDGILKENIRDA